MSEAPDSAGGVRTVLRNLAGRRIVREGLWIALAQAVSVLATLVGVRFLTGLLAPSVYGEFALIAGLGVLARDVLCAPLLSGTLRLYHDADRDGRIGDMIRAVQAMVRRRVWVAACILVVAGAIWAGVAGRPGLAGAFAGAALVVAAEVRRNFENNLLNASRRQRAFALRTSGDTLARFAVAVALVVVLGPHAVWVLVGFAVGTFTVLAVSGRWRVRAAASPPSAEHEAWVGDLARNLGSYGRPLVLTALMTWVYSLSDRYFIAGLADTNAAGLYAAVYGIASQPFLTLSGLATVTLRPLLFDAVARGDRARERRLLAGWLGLVAGMAATGWVLLVVLREPVVHLLLGRAYWPAAEFVPYLAAGYAAIAVQQFFEAILFAHGRTKRLVWVQTAGAVSALAAYAVLIPRAGALGAALGTLISCLTSSVVAALVADLPARFRAERTPREPGATS